MVRNAADYICLNVHLFRAVGAVGGLVCALKIIPMTWSSFPCHKAWLIPQGTNFCSAPRLPLLAPSTSAPLHHMPSVYFPSPIWPCSLSLGPLLSLRIPSHFQSGCKLPSKHGPHSTFQDVGATDTMVSAQLLTYYIKQFYSSRI